MSRSGHDDAVRVLREAGILNPGLLPRLMGDAIARFATDLTGLAVLTEAASGPFVVTPVLAALAGAKRVLAATRDSTYAPATTVIEQTRALECLCGAPPVIEICTQRSVDLFAQADIVTNLGFVRPIDAFAVAAMKPTCVVLLMYEAWERRPEDVDLEACKRRRVRVLGTNEASDGADVFPGVGLLAAKMLLDAQVDVRRSRVVIVSSDKFGTTIRDRLACLGADVELSASLRASRRLAAAHAIVIADCTRTDMIVGARGEMTAENLSRVAPGATVVVLAGGVDGLDLLRHGIAVHPAWAAQPGRMTKTLAELGPGPVVDLHTAGLKVGELAVRGEESPLMQWVVGR